MSTETKTPSDASRFAVTALDERRFYGYHDAALRIMRYLKTRPATKGQMILDKAIKEGSIRCFQVNGDGALNYELVEGDEWKFDRGNLDDVRVYLDLSGYPHKKEPERFIPRKGAMFVARAEFCAAVAEEFGAEQKAEKERREAFWAEREAEDQREFEQMHPNLATALGILRQRDPRANVYGYPVKQAMIRIEVEGELATWLAEAILAHEEKA